MMSLRLLARNATPRLAALARRLHTSEILLDSESSGSDSSDDNERKEKPPEKEKVETTEQSGNRLNSLLAAMIQQSKTPSKVAVALNPKKPNRIQPQVRTSRSETRKLFDKKLATAAKDVASSLGVDTGKIESELLKKILDQTPIVREPIKMRTLVKGMSIDHETSGKIKGMGRYDEPRRRETSRPTTGGRHQTINASIGILDSGTRMNLFGLNTLAPLDGNTTMLATWEILEKKELKTFFSHPPRNFIEQMIQWTEQGRLWRFPIDNEQDLNIDQEEHFSEHIFLEQHLGDWCPTKGPIRHFMELVCVGLSKNSYLSAKEKRDHIMWYKEYFAKHDDLLKELGAYGERKQSTGEKQIEA